MQELIDNAKADFLRAKGRLCHSLAMTPDDRLTWSPSPTARTPLHQVAHAADSIKHINAMLDGHTFAVPTPGEADPGFRQWESQFTTREAVLEMLEKNSDALVAWLDALQPARLDEMVTLPFSLGVAPMRFVLSAPADHTNWHTAQLDYIQTIYGDRDWHLPETK